MTAPDSHPPTAIAGTCRRRLFFWATLANLVVMTLLGLLLMQSRTQYMERAAISTRNLSLVLEKELVGTLEKVDLALCSVVDQLERQRDRLPGEPLELSLARVRGRLPELEALRVTDAAGKIVSQAGEGGPADVAQGDFFRREREEPRAGLVISRPFRARGGGRWSVALARRVSRPDGSFAGIIYATISLDQFANFLSQLDVGRSGAVALRDSQLRLIVRCPEFADRDLTIGDRQIAAPLWESLRRSPKAGTYRFRPPYDGVERTFSYRKLDGYPLYVIVGFASADYLARWHTLAALAAAMAGLFLLGTLLSSWLIYRNWLRGAKAVEELHEKEERFRAAFESSNDAVLLMTPQGFLDCNQRTVEMFGLKQRDDFARLNPADLSPPLQADGERSRDASSRHVKKAINEGHDRFEWLHKRIDGEVFPCEVLLCAFQVRGELLLQSTVRDITSRKEAQEDLRAKEERFRMLFESSADPCLLIDGETFVDCNPAAVEALRASSKEEVLNSNPWELSPPLQPDGSSSSQKAREYIARAQHEKVIRFEFLHQRKDGSVFPAEVSLTVLPDQGLIYTVWRDITEQKRAQAELEEGRQQLHDIIDFLPDATLVTDTEGRVVAWNRAIEEMTGVSKEEMLGQGEHACSVPFYGERRGHLIDLLDLDNGELEQSYHHVQRRGTTLNAEAFTPALYGGAGAYVWASAAPLYNRKGVRVGAIESVRDITQQKQAEKTIIKYRDHLEEVVAQRTRELLLAKEAAESANRAKSAFMANMSHELRTPLNAIIGFSELALPEAATRRQEYHLGTIREAGRSLLAMINELLDFAKSEEGTLALEPVEFALEEVLAGVLAEAQQKALRKRVELLLFWPSDLPQRLFGDPQRLSQLLGCLLDNAVKFTARGEVELSASQLAEESGSVALCFRLRDTGIGMAPEELERLFSSFTQGDGSSTRRFGGAGVGLTISRRLAALMGGEITVQSAPGKGSTFTLLARFGRPPAVGEPGEEQAAPCGCAEGAASFCWLGAGYAREWALRHKPLYLEAAEAFRVRHGKTPGEISALVATGERTLARELAHRLEGGAGTLGAAELGEAAAALKGALCGAGEVEAALERLHCSHQALLEQLAEVLDRGKEAGCPRDCAEIRCILERLQQYIEQYDGEATGYLESVLAPLREALPGAPWDEIERLLASYEFDQAAVLLQRVYLELPT